jgi:hypothetical protein
MVTVVSFGGGVNSTALLIGCVQRKEPVDLVLFADTGAEFPETYHHVADVSRWLVSHGYPQVVVVSNAIRPPGQKPCPHISLEEECCTNKTLPSLAFGYKGCSVKWKRHPMDWYVGAWPKATQAWESGEKVVRLLGIDAGEPHRSAALEASDDPKYIYRRPLIRWDWDREDCKDAIREAGLQVPRRSACFFCPATKKAEVLQLAKDRPDLLARGIQMERHARENGKLITTKGLGRSWSWEDLVNAPKQCVMEFPEAPDCPCGCFDGERD